MVYIRVQNSTDQFSCTLLAAKTKVAPLKKVTIPKLELNSAVLLSNLMDKVKDALRIPGIQQQAWSDSEITLHWIANHPSRWKTYVANRVSEIQTLLPSHNWRHISSIQNPADCASRGMTRNELETFKLWWHGPEFLTESNYKWPTHEIKIPHNQDLEERKESTVATIQVLEPNPVFMRFSSYGRMLRVLTQLESHKNIKLSVDQLHQTEMRLIKIVQFESFGAEIMSLQKGQPIHCKSAILNLDPYLDQYGILRVGGRIKRAAMTENEKHPIILPRKHHFTTLLIRSVHMETFHGGYALTAQKLQQSYWIVNRQIAIISVLYRCTICLLKIVTKIF